MSDNLPDHIASLKGKALKDRAAELDIAGRSKLNTAELRQAILDSETALRERELEIVPQEEVTTLVKDTVESSEEPSVAPTRHWWDKLHDLALFKHEVGKEASEDSVSAEMMDNSRRKHNYERSNGTAKLTPKQARRLRKKGNAGA